MRGSTQFCLCGTAQLRPNQQHFGLSNAPPANNLGITAGQSNVAVIGQSEQLALSRPANLAGGMPILPPDPAHAAHPPSPCTLPCTLVLA